MRASLPVPAVAVCCFAAAACAQSVSDDARPATAPPPIFAPRALSAAPPATKNAQSARPPPASRAISPETAAKLSSVAARAAAIDAPPASTSGPPRRTDSGDAVQLEPFIVQDRKLPDLKEREVLTPKGKLELAHKLNPGLKAGGVPLGNDGVALAILEDELDKVRRSETRDLKNTLESGGANLPREVRNMVQDALLRKNDWSR